MQNRKALPHSLLGSATGSAALLLGVWILGAPAGAGEDCSLGAVCPDEGTTCVAGECAQLLCRPDPAAGDLVWQIDRFFPIGTACGDGSTAACSGPDGCDGLGECLPNDFIGTTCGPPGDVCGLGQCLPSTLVTSTADEKDLVPGDGACAASQSECTLRAALEETNAIAGAEAVRLPAGTYQLSIAESLIVNDELLLLGAGDDATIIDASGVTDLRVPILIVETEAGSAAISGVTVRDGVVIEDFGIVNAASLSLLDSTVSNLEADAAVFNVGALRMTRSSVTGNQGRYVGALITAEESLAKLTEATVSGNQSGFFGGILNERGQLMLRNSTISGNRSSAVSDPEFSGGGIENLHAETIVVESTVSGNSAVYGGGIENYFGSLSLFDSTVSGNSAYAGGGIANEGGRMIITSSTISGNSAAWGGGIAEYYTYNYSYVVNSTISGNTASYEGGGVVSEGESLLILLNSSVVDNRALAASGGGGLADPSADGGSIGFANTILARNKAGQGVEETSSNCQGADISAGPNNLFDDETCPEGDGSSLIVADALLGPLADNGGPTRTHLPLPGSPAIDAGADGPCPARDQRGESRPQDGSVPPDGEATCDIGSVELVPEPGGALLLGAALASLAAVHRLRARA